MGTLLQFRELSSGDIRPMEFADTDMILISAYKGGYRRNGDLIHIVEAWTSGGSGMYRAEDLHG